MKPYLVVLATAGAGFVLGTAAVSIALMLVNQFARNQTFLTSPGPGAARPSDALFLFGLVGGSICGLAAGAFVYIRNRNT